jgi:hypothetical protein
MVDTVADPCYSVSTAAQENEMKKFRFVMDCNTVYLVIARDFRAACLQWESFGADPKKIKLMECFG